MSGDDGDVPQEGKKLQLLIGPLESLTADSLAKAPDESIFMCSFIILF